MTPKEKARKVAPNLHLGKGATAFLEKMINEAVGKPCPYCGEELTLKNMSVDHIEPLLRSRVPTKKTIDKKKKNLYTDEELTKLYDRNNLEIICKSCNQIKGDIHKDDLIWLLDVLSERQDIKDKVLSRMKGSSFVYRRF